MIRATPAKTATGRAVLCIRCTHCGWTIDVDPRHLFAALKHVCNQQLELGGNRMT